MASEEFNIIRIIYSVWGAASKTSIDNTLVRLLIRIVKFSFFDVMATSSDAGSVAADP